MNYATWKLDFTDPNYGTGPEHKIAELGFGAEASWSDGTVVSGGTILGYISGNPDASQLTDWQFSYITQEEALEFCKGINPKAYLLEDGKITTPIEDIIN